MIIFNASYYITESEAQRSFKKFPTFTPSNLKNDFKTFMDDLQDEPLIWQWNELERAWKTTYLVTICDILRSTFPRNYTTNFGVSVYIGSPEVYVFNPPDIYKYESIELYKKNVNGEAIKENL